MSTKIIPPEDKIPSRTYKVKIRETILKRLAEEENFYVLETSDFDKVVYKPYSTTEKKDEDLPKLDFVIEKVYLQRITDDASKLLVTAYLDSGYLRPDCVKKLVDVNRRKPFLSKPKGRCLIRLYNNDFCELAEIPMKHSSGFAFHPVTGAPQIFLGLIEELEEKKNYYYRIECYNEDSSITAASKLIRFTSSVQKTGKPIFYVSVSDLHGGSEAKFRKGRVRGWKQRNNPRLKKLMEEIDFRDDVYSFDQNYQLITTSGDNVDNGSYHEYWADLFSCGANNFSRFPVFPTIGNHDYY
ncbi:MAG: metallophosphoesterase, partial [Candidatus Heimdallarchaeota archaeon]